MRILQSGTGLRLPAEGEGLGGGEMDAREAVGDGDGGDGGDEEKETGEGLRRRLGKGRYLGPEGDGLRKDTDDSDFEDDGSDVKGNVLVDGVGRKKKKNNNKGGYTASPLIPLETLDKDDPRAVEFRERLRNWSVSLADRILVVRGLEVGIVADTTRAMSRSFPRPCRFGRVPFSSITLPDARAWLSWSCCGMSYEQVQQDPDKSRLIETGLRLLQARTGWMFPLGSAEQQRRGGGRGGPREKVRLMRLTMDPVKVWPRPLWWYAALWAGDVLAMRYIYRSFGLRKVSPPWVSNRSS